MKKLFTVIAITASTFAIATAAIAAEEKKPAESAKAEQPGKPAPEKVVGEAKSIPMHVRVDAIDAAAKTFTMKKKDGVEVKHVVPEGTGVKQGPAAAKFEDIKVGDYVSGLRKKVSDTEYTVEKITKFGPEEKKEKGAAKPAEKKAEAKPAEKKPDAKPEEKKAN